MQKWSSSSCTLPHQRFKPFHSFQLQSYDVVHTAHSFQFLPVFHQSVPDSHHHHHSLNTALSQSFSPVYRFHQFCPSILRRFTICLLGVYIKMLSWTTAQNRYSSKSSNHLPPRGQADCSLEWTNQNQSALETFLRKSSEPFNHSFHANEMSLVSYQLTNGSFHVTNNFTVARVHPRHWYCLFVFRT